MSNTTATTPTTTDTSPSPTSTQDLLSLISASLTALKSQESSLASASASVLGKTPTNSTPNSYKIIGIVLALISGLFIGSSFVFKKKGLLNSQQKSIEKGCAAGEGHEYLKSPMWWSGMILMILGEICNFVAYAFADAILVTPMGALSVVISAILSSIFLKERLSFFGKVGCFLCIVGATIIALNAPEEQAASTIPEFQKLFIAPGFLVFGTIVILTALVLIFYVAPKYGKSNMLVFISICSIIGGLSVVCTQGLGASIITSIKGDSQFKYWFMYFLIGFVICTLVTEINYLNKALELYNTAMVTPTYYVMFTFSTLLTSIILFQGLKAPVLDIVTLVLGFLVICSGITLLQMSKIDPKDLALDEKSSIFLNADKELDNESGLAAEEPGVDGLRGFGGLMGSIHRNSLIARQSNASSLAAMHDRNMTRRRRNGDGASDISRMPSNLGSPIQGLRKHGLWDRPMDAPTHSRSGSKEKEFVRDDLRLNVLNKYHNSSSEAGGRSVSPSGSVPSMSSSMANNYATSDREKLSKMSSNEGTDLNRKGSSSQGHFQGPYESNLLGARGSDSMAQNQEKAEDFAQWLGDRWSVADQSSSNQQNAVRRVSANQNREEDYYEGGGVGETKMLKSRARQILISEELSSSPKSFENDDDGIIHPYRKKSHNKESYYFQKNQGVGARMKKGFRSGTDAVGGGVGSVGGVGTKRIGGGGGEKTVEMESLVRTRSSSDSSSFSYGSKSSSNERITKSDHQGKKRFSSSSNNNTRNDGKNRDNQKRNTATNKMKKRKDKKGIKEEEEEEEGRTGEQEAYDYDEFEISRINVLISHD